MQTEALNSYYQSATSVVIGITTIQHDECSMDYSGNSFGMVKQGIIDVTMSYTRALNSAASVSVNQTQ